MKKNICVVDFFLDKKKFYYNIVFLSDVVYDMFEKKGGFI